MSSPHDIVVALIEEGYPVDDIPGIIEGSKVFSSYDAFIELTINESTDLAKAILPALDYDQFGDELVKHGVHIIELPDLEVLVFVTEDTSEHN